MVGDQPIVVVDHENTSASASAILADQTSIFFCFAFLSQI